MTNLITFEKNVINSFKKVKTDIVKIWERLDSKTKEHEDIKNRVNELEQMQTVLVQNINFLRDAMPKNRIIANKDSGTVHRENCFFAKKINEKNREYFNTLEEIRGLDLKKCTCMST
ncbi:hypothetical protein GF327_07770 [Candidatus Woesearchaeota archaeon]|nr:hypothetical protein [Candidatus Woesearchaeota archaeon]